MRRFLPYLALGASILMLGSSAILVRWAAAPPTVMAFYRTLIAGTIMAPLFWRGGSRPARLAPGWVIWPLLAGFFSALDMSIWNTALEYTSAANATLLGNTAPLWVALFAWLALGERLGRVFWFGLVLALGGAAVILGEGLLDQLSANRGDLLSLVSALAYAAFYLATQRGRRNLDALSQAWIASVGSLLSLLIFSLLTGSPLSGYSPQTYLIFLAAGLGPQLVGYLALSYALGRLPASIVAPTMIAQPVLTALLAIPLLGEALSLAQIGGGVLVLIGIYLVNNSAANPDFEEADER